MCPGVCKHFIILLWLKNELLTKLMGTIKKKFNVSVKRLHLALRYLVST